MPSETGQTDYSAVDQGEVSQISDESLELPIKLIKGKGVGKISESSETPRAKSGIGSGADAFGDDDDPAWGARPEVA